MIFSIDDHIKKIIEGSKTQTRRPSDRYKIGRTYAVQPGRGRPGIPEGRIFMFRKKREWKPDYSDIPLHARFARSMVEGECGYPISRLNAGAEGGYTPFEFEELYESMYPGWENRCVYFFHFFTAEELERLGDGEKQDEKDGESHRLRQTLSPGPIKQPKEVKL